MYSIPLTCILQLQCCIHQMWSPCNSHSAAEVEGHTCPLQRHTPVPCEGRQEELATQRNTHNSPPGEKNSLTQLDPYQIHVHVYTHCNKIHIHVHVHCQCTLYTRTRTHTHHPFLITLYTVPLYSEVDQ